MAFYCLNSEGEKGNLGNRVDFLESTGLAYEKGEGNLGERFLITYEYSYYEYNEKKDEFNTDPMFRRKSVILEADKTAMIVMDPWRDSPFDEMNENIAENIEEYVMPVIGHAIDNKIPVIVFTNDPNTVTYNTKIDEGIEELVEANKISLFYHTKFNRPEEFGEYLKDNNIESLIYVGYATQLCVLYRNVGMLSMYMSDYKFDFNLYIIPEATLAAVSDDGDYNLQMRNDICTMLAQQGIAKIVPCENFVNYTFGIAESAID